MDSRMTLRLAICHPAGGKSLLIGVRTLPRAPSGEADLHCPQSASRDRLLGSTSRLAVRTELPTLVVWVVAAGTFAAILGAFAKSIADQASKIHLHAFTQVTTASGYLALSFVLFTLAVSLFATSHISTMRDDESSGRLETLFALPIARRSWLVGRLAVATGSSVALARSTSASAAYSSPDPSSVSCTLSPAGSLSSLPR